MARLNKAGGKLPVSMQGWVKRIHDGYYDHDGVMHFGWDENEFDKTKPYFLVNLDGEFPSGPRKFMIDIEYDNARKLYEFLKRRFGK